MRARFQLTNPRLLGKTAEEAARLVGLAILRDTVQLCPVDLGTLAQSYTLVVDKTGDTSATAHVGTNVEYAPYVEFGHGVITPKRASVLRWEKGGQVFFAHRVGAYPPRSHLGEAFKRAQRRYG
jgi:tetrahydromethanopterin S-methyltransferase subunit E